MGLVGSSPLGPRQSSPRTWGEVIHLGAPSDLGLRLYFEVSFLIFAGEDYFHD